MSCLYILFIFIATTTWSYHHLLVRTAPIDLQWIPTSALCPPTPPNKPQRAPAKREGGGVGSASQKKENTADWGCAPCDGYCAACDGGSQDVSGAAVGVHLMGHDNQMKTALQSQLQPAPASSRALALARDSVLERPLNYWPTEAYAEPRSAHHCVPDKATINIYSSNIVD